MWGSDPLKWGRGGKVEQRNEKVLKAGATLSPFLPAIGIEDLDRGFDALERLEKRKSQVGGRYVPAKTGRAWLLRRGPLLGDPKKDRNLWRGRPIAFPALNSKRGDQVEVHDLAELLRREGLPFIPEEVRWAVETYGLKVGKDLDRLAQEVMREGAEWTTKALQGFWEALGNSPHPNEMEAIEARLQEGGEARLRCVKSGDPSSREVLVKVKLDDGVNLAFHGVAPFDSLTLRARPGFVEVQGLFGPDLSAQLLVVGNWASFKGRDREALGEALEAVGVLRPLLSAMGHEGLEKALSVLGALEKRESRLEEPYVLARAEDFWALRRGLFLGDPLLDGAFLLGESVTLSFPGDAEFTFRGSLSLGALHLSELRIRLGEEVVDLGARSEFGAYNLKGVKDPLAEAIRRRLLWEFEDLENYGIGALAGASPKMLTFLGTFADHEDPFRALAEGKFRPHITAHLFKDI